MGALLGLSGGIAASFTVNQGASDSPTEGLLTPVEEPEHSASPPVVKGESSPAIIYLDISLVSGRIENPSTDSRLPSQYLSPSTSTMRRDVVVASPSSPSSPVTGIEAGLVTTLVQVLSTVQWARELLAQVLIVGDVNLDGVLDVQDLALVRWPSVRHLPIWTSTATGWLTRRT